MACGWLIPLRKNESAVVNNVIKDYNQVNNVQKLFIKDESESFYYKIFNCSQENHDDEIKKDLKLFWAI